MTSAMNSVNDDTGTTMRSCGSPLCANTFDIAAHLGGKVDAGRWMNNRLVHLLCPACSVGAHVPDWALVDAAAQPRCSCGWKGEPAETIGAAAKQWRGHVREAPSAS